MEQRNQLHAAAAIIPWERLINFRLDDVWVSGFVWKFGEQQISVILGIEPRSSTAWVSLFNTSYGSSIYDIDTRT